MGGANNGGLGFFLSQSHDLDAQEVLASLELVGANIAAVPNFDMSWNYLVKRCQLRRKI
jgi:hypothetical protein